MSTLTTTTAEIAAQLAAIRSRWDRKKEQRSLATPPPRDPMGSRFWARGYRWNGRGYSPGNGRGI